MPPGLLRAVLVKTIGKGDPSGHEWDILRFPLGSPEQLHSSGKGSIIPVHLSSGNAPEVVRGSLR